MQAYRISRTRGGGTRGMVGAETAWDLQSLQKLIFQVIDNVDRRLNFNRIPI